MRDGDDRQTCNHRGTGRSAKESIKRPVGEWNGQESQLLSEKGPAEAGRR